MMKKTGEIVSLLILIVVYALLSFRYFPDQPAETFYATLMHLLSTIPFVLGITFIVSVLFQKLAKERLPWERVLRIFLGISIFVEFIYGLYDYLSRAV